MELIAAFTAGLSVFLLAAYAIRARALTPAESRLRFLTPRRDVRIEADEQGAILRRSASSIPAVTRLLTRRGYAERWAYDLERAGLSLRPGEYFLIRAMLAVVTFAVVFVVARNALAFVIGIALAVVAYMLPAFWLKMRVSRRIGALEKQLVETITLIANAQRAGFAFSQGVDVAAKRVGPPMSVELNRMLLDVNLGASTEDALMAMNERVGSDDLDMVITAILIQRQTGGNLAEVLDNVTETMRDRERIQGEIKTLTASQRLTGMILSAWPLVLGLLFAAINPSMTSLMWTTTPGIVLLCIWATLNFLGFITLRKILDIDI